MLNINMNKNLLMNTNNIDTKEVQDLNSLNLYNPVKPIDTNGMQVTECEKNYTNIDKLIDDFIKGNLAAKDVIFYLNKFNYGNSANPRITDINCKQNGSNVVVTFKYFSTSYKLICNKFASLSGLDDKQVNIYSSNDLKNIDPEIIGKYFYTVSQTKFASDSDFSGNKYAIKEEYGCKTLDELQKKIYSEYQEKLILANFLADQNKTDNTLKNNKFMTKDINYQNIMQYIDDIESIIGEDSEAQKETIVNKFINDFIQGNLAAVDVSKVLNAAGIKYQTTRLGLYTCVLFRYNGKNYKLMCNQSLARAGNDNLQAETYTADFLKDLSLSSALIQKYFEPVGYENNKVTQYKLKNGLKFENLIKEHSQSLVYTKKDLNKMGCPSSLISEMFEKTSDGKNYKFKSGVTIDDFTSKLSQITNIIKGVASNTNAFDEYSGESLIEKVWSYNTGNGSGQSLYDNIANLSESEYKTKIRNILRGIQMTSTNEEESIVLQEGETIENKMYDKVNSLITDIMNKIYDEIVKNNLPVDTKIFSELSNQILLSTNHSILTKYCTKTGNNEYIINVQSLEQYIYNRFRTSINKAVSQLEKPQPSSYEKLLLTSSAEYIDKAKSVYTFDLDSIPENFEDKEVTKYNKENAWSDLYEIYDDIYTEIFFKLAGDTNNEFPIDKNLISTAYSIVRRSYELMSGLITTKEVNGQTIYTYNKAEVYAKVIELFNEKINSLLSNTDYSTHNILKDPKVNFYTSSDEEQKAAIEKSYVVSIDKSENNKVFIGGTEINTRVSKNNLKLKKEQLGTIAKKTMEAWREKIIQQCYQNNIPCDTSTLTSILSSLDVATILKKYISSDNAEQLPQDIINALNEKMNALIENNKILNPYKEFAWDKNSSLTLNEQKFKTDLQNYLVTISIEMMKYGAQHEIEINGIKRSLTELMETVLTLLSEEDLLKETCKNLDYGNKIVSLGRRIPTSDDTAYEDLLSEAVVTAKGPSLITRLKNWVGWFLFDAFCSKQNGVHNYERINYYYADNNGGGGGAPIGTDSMTSPTQILDETGLADFITCEQMGEILLDMFRLNSSKIDAFLSKIDALLTSKLPNITALGKVAGPVASMVSSLSQMCDSSSSGSERLLGMLGTLGTASALIGGSEILALMGIVVAADSFAGLFMDKTPLEYCFDLIYDGIVSIINYIEGQIPYVPCYDNIPQPPAEIYFPVIH